MLPYDISQQLCLLANYLFSPLTTIITTETSCQCNRVQQTRSSKSISWQYDFLSCMYQKFTVSSDLEEPKYCICSTTLLLISSDGNTSRQRSFPSVQTIVSSNEGSEVLEEVYSLQPAE